ncbi:MAG: protein jag [Firmicutes bacterium]|jgi:spoIIIJ-associated protein|nr:protein jag [Bacillota bacterium]
MTHSVEKSGKTVEEAIQGALKDLDLPSNKVEIEVLEEPSKGILGLIGQRPARVKVTKKICLADKICDFFQDLIEHAGLGDVSFTSVFEDGVLELEIKSDDVGTLIGRRGTTLDALQYIINIVAGNYWRQLEARGFSRERVRVVVDVQGYRRRRAASLERLAHSVAERVVRDGGEIRLEPMNPMERRVVHLAIGDCKGVESYSEGEDPFRYVVVSYKNKGKE